MQENEDQDDEHDVQADIASHAKAIQTRKPTSEISYIDLVNYNRPLLALSTPSVKRVKLGLKRKTLLQTAVEFFNHYDYPVKAFHEAWQSITHGALGEITDAYLVNRFDAYRRNQFSDTQWESYVKSSLFRLFSSNTDVRTNTVQLLRRCAREVKLSDDLLFNICTRCRGEELSSVLEIVFGLGLDPNVIRANQTSSVDRPLHAFALRDQILPYLLNHPKIVVNALDHFGQTPLLRSAENPKAAKIFLNDPRVNVNASTAPQKEFDYFMSRCKDVEVRIRIFSNLPLTFLVAKGVKITQKGNYLRIVLESERPLNDKIALWELLINAGIDIDTTDYPQTTLHLAAMSGTADEVAVLLDLGADINGKRSCSCSPLHAAAARGAINVTKLLLARGADPKRKNLAGKTAEEVAVYSTKQLFRKVAPALEIEYFFGHRIHFAGEPAPASRYAVELYVMGGNLWVQGGSYLELRRDYEHSDDYAQCPHFDLWCASIDESDPKAIATWTEIPVAHGIDFGANSALTVNVNQEIWYFGYNKNWIKYNTSTLNWTVNSPCLNAKHHWLKMYKGYDRGSYKHCTYRIDKVTGAVTSRGFAYGSEDIENLNWNHRHILQGDKIWLKAKDKTVPENVDIEYMFCLDLAQDKWFKVCPVPFEINSGMTPFSTHYLVTATFNRDTEEFKLVLFDTDSLKWTTHEVALIDNERLVACEELSLIVHGTRLIVFGGHVKEDTCTNALYSIDLSPIHGVHSLASIAARAVVASQPTLTQHEIDRLPQDIKTKMGF